MPDVPAVSVIIAVFNAAPFLDECLDSLVAQTFEDWEVVACDDASTDRSVEILERWSRRDSRIRVVRNAVNLGAAATRNRAIEMCRGKYIAIQDADDLSKADRLERQVSYLDANPGCAFVSSGLYLFDDMGIYGQRIPGIPLPGRRDFLVNTPYCHASTMFRRLAIESVNGYRVATETTRGQDYDLFMRLHADGFQGHNIPDCLYGYRDGCMAYHRRRFRYRLDEVVIRFKGFRQLGLLPWAIPFVFKPVLVGAIPSILLRRVKRVADRPSLAHS